uniref:transposase n=1 Tax=Parolsenella massiliensis TaxID=1871022 RepID=UPI00139054DF|nr:transposase [Parolsenella massiliensis]
MVAKGSGGQSLFEEDADYQSFLGFLSKNCERFGVRVHAYCLMGNHVHLLLEDRDSHLSETMGATLTSYALRFNQKHGHIGHVFQQRFKSQPVETDEYLLRAIRYIHSNPAKAGICPACEYRWSSYRAYVEGEESIVETSFALDVLGGVEGFLAFSSETHGDYRFSQRSRISDAEARQIASRVLGDVAPAELKVMERPHRDALLFGLKDAGLSIRQIERLTGIGRGTIAKS